VVSDNSASGAALVGRTEEQQKQYDFGRMVVLPDMILTLANRRKKNLMKKFDVTDSFIDDVLSERVPG
jgi:hypothetical protein